LYNNTNKIQDLEQFVTMISAQSSRRNGVNIDEKKLNLIKLRKSLLSSLTCIPSFTENEFYEDELHSILNKTLENFLNQNANYKTISVPLVAPVKSFIYDKPKVTSLASKLKTEYNNNTQVQVPKIEAKTL